METSNKKSHKEWRKEAKKMRRKRIRQTIAAERHRARQKEEDTPAYKEIIAKQKLLEEALLEKEKLINVANYKKWIENEKEAQRIWNEKKRLEAVAVEQRQIEQQKIREEWENEQQKIIKAKEKEKKLLEEEKKRKDELLLKIEVFISSGGEIPEELQACRESHPGQPMCPFFMKVGACRFGFACSRNHVQVSISRILVFMNFYSHFSMDQNSKTEYDTDINLEYEDSDMIEHFRNFYLDVMPELKQYGEVVFMRVCSNFEPHLRGNLYVEYKNERAALRAYRQFNGRWYGGKQINVEFTKIPSWHAAICGDFIKKNCPKGKHCNFLHVFKNPKNEFPLYDVNKRITSPKQSESSRHWRWSESPERSVNRRHDTSTSKRRNRSSLERRSTRKEKEYKTSRSSERERSQSNERHLKEKNQSAEKNSRVYRSSSGEKRKKRS